MPGAHAPLSPSAAKIWMTCPDQPSLAAQVPEDSSEYAAEGTTAHALAQRCLIPHIQTGTVAALNPDQHLGETIEGQVVTKEMCDAVRVYLNFCVKNTRAGSHIRIEERLRLCDDVWGTGDYIAYNAQEGELLVVDYKHGAGVFVHAYENPQTLTYALMACRLYKGVRRVRIVIVQPRCGSEEEPIREWVVDTTELLDFEADLMEAVARTKIEEAGLNPGIHCRFCPVKAQCPELVRLVAERIKEAIDMATKLKPVELGNRLSELPALKTYINGLEDFAFKLAMEGGHVPGHKLVEKRPTRKFRNENQAADALMAMGLTEQDIMDVKLKTVAAVEKLIGKSNMSALEDLIVKESSGLTLVDINDKRPEYAPGTAAQAFGMGSLEDLLG